MPRSPLSMMSTLLLIVGLSPWLFVADANAQSPQQVQQLLDAEQPGLALDMLSRMIKGKKPTAEQLMLRGTARLMLGEIKAGATDLEKSLAKDPTLRQSWVNLGGLEIAEGNYDAAEKAFRKAYQLAPDLPDSHLNLGAALMLLRRGGEAEPHFEQYLKLEGGSAEAQYLVATNYAIGDVEHLAIKALEAAIAQDEKMRLRARRDSRFVALDSLEYRVLLNTDNYQPPPGSHQVEAAFRQPYNQQDGELLYAVLEALRSLGISYDPEVEAAAKWAIVWGDLRIKLRNQANGTGVVALSAAPSRYSADEFHRLSQRIFQEIHRTIGQ